MFLRSTPDVCVCAYYGRKTETKGVHCFPKQRPKEGNVCVVDCDKETTYKRKKGNREGKKTQSIAAKIAYKKRTENERKQSDIDPISC
ncbi:hypothetical protein L1887_08797 [Cichorium endivia]|nr:hypothetical protein L1887_08797 [Cichorium endivia]